MPRKSETTPEPATLVEVRPLTDWEISEAARKEKLAKRAEDEASKKKE